MSFLVSLLCNEACIPGVCSDIFVTPYSAFIFFLNNQPCYKTLHVSGIFSAHHQEFSTVHSVLVSFM